jgi:uncharacterized protein YggU (UPF0235/DUF167 family)
VTASGIDLTATAAGARLKIRVMPRAPRSRLDGVRDGRLVVRVTAAPVDRAANDAAIDLLARTLGLPSSTLRITAGATDRNKTVEIAAPVQLVRDRLQDVLTARR